MVFNVVVHLAHWLTTDLFLMFARAESVPLSAKDTNLQGFNELGFPAKHSRLSQAQNLKKILTVPDDQDGEVERIRHQQERTQENDGLLPMKKFLTGWREKPQNPFTRNHKRGK
jgi:hypothetical protein